MKICKSLSQIWRENVSCRALVAKRNQFSTNHTEGFEIILQTELRVRSGWTVTFKVRGESKSVWPEVSFKLMAWGKEPWHKRTEPHDTKQTSRHMVSVNCRTQVVWGGIPALEMCVRVYVCVCVFSLVSFMFENLWIWPKELHLSRIANVCFTKQKINIFWTRHIL